MKVRLVVLMAFVILGVFVILRAPEPRICPYRTYDWTLRCSAGEFGVVELGYIQSRFPHLGDIWLKAGPFGDFGLVKVVGWLLILLAMAVWCIHIPERIPTAREEL